MARKRPLPKYAGALAEPIYVDTVSGEPDEWIKAQVFEKMALLCTHYKIDPSEENVGENWRSVWRSSTSLDYNFRSGRNLVANRHGRRD